MPAPAPRHQAILNAVEQDPGHWHMHAGADTTEHPYACIRLLEITVRDRGRLKRYRVVTWKPASADRVLVGYYDALARACEAARKHRQHEASTTAWTRDAALATAYGDPGELARRRARNDE